MDLVLRAIFLYVFVYALTRVIGRREISTLQPFDLILLIVVGDAIQQGLTQDDYSVAGGVLVIGTFALLQVSTSFLSFHFTRLRPILEEVRAQARKQQIESLDQVKWAVLETSGEITFLKK
jgi:uncharacterized membrane protein YcaP (DUF421 family)